MTPAGVEIHVGEAQVVREGEARAELQPTWGTMLASSEAVARRTGADPHRIAEMLSLLSADKTPAAAVSQFLD